MRLQFFVSRLFRKGNSNEGAESDLDLGMETGG